jgi:hypothetical protein
MKKIESGKFGRRLKKLKDETGKAHIVARDKKAAHQIMKEWREQNG